MKLLLCAIAGYLLGSISVSILVTKYIFHDDLRQQGSGNAGATNAARVYGLGAGVLTFAGDFAKSILAMLLGRGLGGVMGLAVGGAACLLGHCFPVYFKFKGGKAVSAGAAVLLGCRLCGAESLVTGVSVVLAAMPMGGVTAVLAEKYGGDSAFASKCVAVSTVLSLITTPLWCMVV